MLKLLIVYLVMQGWEFIYIFVFMLIDGYIFIVGGVFGFCIYEVVLVCKFEIIWCRKLDNYNFLEIL